MHDLNPVPGPFGRRSFLEPWWHIMAGSLMPDLDGPHYEGIPIVGQQMTWYGRRTSVFAGGDVADFASFLLAGEDDGAYIRSVAGGSGLVVPRLESGSPTESALIRAIGGLHRTVIPCTVAPRIDLGLGWDSYESRRSTKTKATLRRKARKLGEVGAISYRHVVATHEVADTLPIVFALYAARAATVSRGPLWLSGPGQAFLAAWMHGLADEGRLDLTVMYVGDRPCAFCFGIKDPDTYYLYGLAFDPHPDVARWSPGQQLLAHLIQHASELGVKWFDFLIGDEPYKSEWATESRAVYTLVAAPGLLPVWSQSAPFEMRRALYAAADRAAPLRKSIAKMRSRWSNPKQWTR